MKITKNKKQIRLGNGTQVENRGVYESVTPLILAKQVLIKGENKREFIEFVDKLRTSLNINTQIEAEIFKKYIFSSWKLRRAREMEKNLLNKQQIFEEEGKIFYSEFGGAISRSVPSKRKRIRNISKLYISDELQEIINFQHKLEKQTTKILEQLREEQALSIRTGATPAPGVGPSK